MILCEESNLEWFWVTLSEDLLSMMKLGCCSGFLFTFALNCLIDRFLTKIFRSKGNMGVSVLMERTRWVCWGKALMGGGDMEGLLSFKEVSSFLFCFLERVDYGKVALSAFS